MRLIRPTLIGRLFGIYVPVLTPRFSAGHIDSLIRHALPIFIAPRIENRLEFIGGLFHFAFPAQLDGFALCGGDLMAAESGVGTGPRASSDSGCTRNSIS